MLSIEYPFAIVGIGTLKFTVIVRFTKSRNPDRSHTLTCVRDDGSTTGMTVTEFFIRHDLTHFAVESILGYEDAFYGLVAKGWDVDSFSEREPGSRKSRTLPEIALFTETLVGALDLDWTAGARSSAEILEQIKTTHLDTQILPSEEQIQSIRLRRDELWKSWNALPSGDTLEFCF